LSGDHQPNDPVAEQGDILAPRPHSSGLNESHVRHLLSSLQYADKLLQEMEEVLTSSSSGSPFPKYLIDFTPVQARMVRDYSLRFRNQVKRILDGLGIAIPGPQFGAIHSMRVHLGFIRIALQEASPSHLAGYGPVPEHLLAELNGFSEELQGLVQQLDTYLAQGPGRDLSERIKALGKAGAQTGLLRELERIVSENSLVEFRPALSTIVDRLSSNRYEIAIFGQVSSGKSSLLNHVIGSDVLPVGVNPITAVPTRIVYGATPRLIVASVGGQAQTLDVDRISDFATEQKNPSNQKAVVRLTLEYPSPRLRDGIVFVDTPGLGSLATSGAEETRAYLPRCDLAVVLINAASPLSEDDVQLISAINAAAIPARVLLSKVDLLGAEQQRDVTRYVSEQLRTQLGMDVPVHPVSIISEYVHLLDRWFGDEIAPLYDRYQELRQESIQRKTALLSEAVERSLKAQVEVRATGRTDAELAAVRHSEKDLRSATGLFTDAEKRCFDMSDELRELRPAAIEWAAGRLTELWSHGGIARPPEMIRRAVNEVATEFSARIVTALRELATHLADALEQTSAAMGEEPTVIRNELLAAVRETPQIDAGDLAVKISRPFWSFLGAGATRASTRRALDSAIGEDLDRAFVSFSRLHLSWVRNVLAQMRLVFDSRAEAWRAQVQRMIGASEIPERRRESIINDLELLGGRSRELDGSADAAEPVSDKSPFHSNHFGV